MKKRLLEIKCEIGNTPVVKLEHDNINLFAKLEFNNFTQSIKSRPAYLIIKTAIEERKVNKETTVIESSSGNMAIALAEICSRLELKFVAVIDPYISDVNEKRLRSLPCQVIKVSKADKNGGYLISRIEKVKELCNKPNTYWTNQYRNRFNYLAHYHGTGHELCRQFMNIDYAFIGVSSGGTITGISKKLKERYPRIRIIAVDAEGSVIFSQSPKTRKIPGLGSSIRPAILDEADIDEIVHASDEDIIRGCHELNREHSIYAGGSSGAVYAAIGNYFSRSKLIKKPNVVFLCADSGESYRGLIYEDPDKL